ncbi:unnamed protein product, partial [Rhizoctonia solani]
TGIELEGVNSLRRILTYSLGALMPDPSLLEALQSLRNAVAALPDLTPVAHQSAIVYRMFRDLPSGTTKDVCQQTVNAYKHCFVNPPSKRSPVDNIMRGTYGLDCVLRYLEKFIRLPGLSASCCAQIRQEIEQLTVLVYTRIQSVSGLGTRATPILPYPAQPKRVQLQPEAADDPESEINDQTYVQKNQTREDNLEEIWQDTNDENDSDGSAGMDPPVEITLNKEPTSTRIGAAGRGPDDPKRRWALANYEAPVPGRFENGTAAWVFNCKYCGHARRVPWTEGCQFIQHERLPIPSPNLTSHLYKCRNIPTACNWEAWTARKQAGATGIPHPNQLATQSLGALFEAIVPIPPPSPGILPDTLFRSALVQGVVHDTLPLTFGEGEVMRYVFKLVNPLVDLPSHQTMRRDLSELFKILSGRVSHVIQNQRARLAVTSDAWSSKSSIYSIAGVFITFIDKFWNLQDLVVDVVHLAADHRGTAMGQKIFNALRQKNATNNLIASITDNASNNETMNQEIAWQTQLKSTYKLHSQNMSVTCICHAIHLISSAILHSLGAIDTAALEDGYDIAKSFDCSERVEESQAVREEDARIQSGNIWKGDSHVPGELEDDLNNVDPDELELTSNDIAVPESEKLHAQKSQQRSRSLSLVQKVHAIAVHSTASPLRYKQMGEYIRLYCPEKLAVITSMPVRWGTALAELRRALILRPAFDHWVNTVDIRKQGFGKEKRQIAQALKRKLLMADDEWAVVEDLTIILAPLEAATLSFSKRGKANLPDVLLTYAHLHNGLQKSQTHLQKYVWF